MTADSEARGIELHAARLVAVATLTAAVVAGSIAFLVAQWQSQRTEEARVADLRLQVYSDFVDETSGIATAIQQIASVLESGNRAARAGPLNSSLQRAILLEVVSALRRRNTHQLRLNAIVVKLRLVGEPGITPADCECHR